MFNRGSLFVVILIAAFVAPYFLMNPRSNLTGHSSGQGSREAWWGSLHTEAPGATATPVPGSNWPGSQFQGSHSPARESLNRFPQGSPYDAQSGIFPNEQFRPNHNGGFVPSPGNSQFLPQTGLPNSPARNFMNQPGAIPTGPEQLLPNQPSFSPVPQGYVPPSSSVTALPGQTADPDGWVTVRTFPPGVTPDAGDIPPLVDSQGMTTQAIPSQAIPPQVTGPVDGLPPGLVPQLPDFHLQPGQPAMPWQQVPSLSPQFHGSVPSPAAMHQGNPAVGATGPQNFAGSPTQTNGNLPPGEQPPQRSLTSIDQVFEFSKGPDWMFGNFPRVSSQTVDSGLTGLRVAMVSGTQLDDLAGSLTYYFDPNQQLRRIGFMGNSGDPERLVTFLTGQYGFQPEPEFGAGLFARRENGQVASALRLRQAQIVRQSQPRNRYQVQLELNQPGAGGTLSPEFQAILAEDQRIIAQRSPLPQNTIDSMTPMPQSSPQIPAQANVPADPQPLTQEGPANPATPSFQVAPSQAPNGNSGQGIANIENRPGGLPSAPATVPQPMPPNVNNPISDYPNHPDATGSPAPLPPRPSLSPADSLSSPFQTRERLPSPLRRAIPPQFQNTQEPPGVEPPLHKG